MMRRDQLRSGLQARTVSRSQLLLSQAGNRVGRRRSSFVASHLVRGIAVHRSRLRFAAALTCLAIILPACRAELPVEPQPTAIAVEVLPVTLSPFFPAIEAFGSVSHSARVEIYPAVEAPLVSVTVDEGDRVTVGQILAQLDRSRLEVARTQIQAQLESGKAREALAREQLREGRRTVEANMVLIAKAERELAQRETEYRTLAERLYRARQLHSIGGIPPSELEALKTHYLRSRTERDQAYSDLNLRSIGYRDKDLIEAGMPVPDEAGEREELLLRLNTAQLRSRLDVAVAERAATESELMRLEMTLEDTAIRSPLDGVVATRNADPGARVRPEQALFTVIETNKLYAHAAVAEEQLPQVSPGAPVALFVGRERLTVLAGTVERITPYIDPGTRSSRVRILLDDSATHLVPGTFVRAEITAAEPEAVVALPVAVLSHDSLHRDRVFVVNDGRAESRLVARIPSRAAAAPAAALDIDNTDPVRSADLVLSPDREMLAQAESNQALISGLQDGDLVIVTAEGALRDGAPVAPVIQGGLQ